MGAGNWFPDGYHEGHADYVYVDTSELEGEAEDFEAFYRTLQEDIAAALPKTFFREEFHRLPSDMQGRGETVFMRNPYMSVNFADNNGDIVVIFRYHDKTTTVNEADWRGKQVARRLVGKLLERYELRVRCGPWTSMRVEYPQDAISNYVGGTYVRV